MRTPAHETAVYLTALTGFGPLGGSDQWSVFVGREPLSPVDVVTVYDTGGTAALLLPDIRRPTIQIRVRSASYDNAWQKINEAYEELVGVVSYDTFESRVIAWAPFSDVQFIGRDDGDRALFTCNFNFLRQGPTS